MKASPNRFDKFLGHQFEDHVSNNKGLRFKSPENFNLALIVERDVAKQVEGQMDSRCIPISLQNALAYGSIIGIESVVHFPPL